MIRNLKALGLALVAVFAFSAMAAAGASAQGMLTTSSGNPMTLEGKETGTLLANALTGPLGSVTCDESTYSGHEFKSPVNGVPNKATTATITPHYNQAECKAHIPILGTRPATVTTNGCDYVFHVGGTVSGSYSVTADVVCTAPNVIEVEIFKPNVEHSEANRICLIKVGSLNNSGLTGGILTNGTGGHVNLTGTFENIHTENSGSLCGSGTSETADLDVDATISGEDALGNTGVSVSD